MPLPELPGAPSEMRLAFDDARLQIGHSLQMQSLGDQSPIRHYVKLLGFSKGRSIIVSTPTEDDKVVLMRAGQAFIVRAFSGKHAYAFTANILHVTNTPYPHLHMAYPADVRGLVVRGSARANVNLIACVSCEDNPAQTTDGVMTDLSITGARIASRTRLAEKGRRIAVRCAVALDGIEAQLALPAVVRNFSVDRRNANEANVINHGIEFIDVAQQDRMVLSAFVNQALLEHAHVGF